MKNLFALFILFNSCQNINKTSTKKFQPNDLNGLWQVDNKDHPGSMEFKSDSLLIMEYQGYKSFSSYRIVQSDTQNILEIHPKGQDSLKIAYMRIEKINPDEITIEFVKLTILNKLNNTYNYDTSHLGSIITLTRNK